MRRRAAAGAVARGPLRLSIIVPFHKNLRHLERCLAAIAASPREGETIVVADGAPDDCHEVAARYGARVHEMAGPSGPAAARNRGAAVATGDVLVFVDSDVVVERGAIERMRDVLEMRPEVAAVFGTYDDSPAESNLVSQYKNLAHAFIHQSSRPASQSFWAGFGAIRAGVFAAVNGFDERFRRPCIEDIDLGYRLNGAGYRVLLDRNVRCCHLKRWTLRSLVTTDVRDRAIPWTQLILRTGRLVNDLNLRGAYRASVALAYVLLGLLVASALEPLALVWAAVAGGALGALNWRFYSFCARCRGAAFVFGVVPLHLLYYLYSGLSYLVGHVLYYLSRGFDVRLPGTIALDPWPPARSAAMRGRGV